MGNFYLASEIWVVLDLLMAIPVINHWNYTEDHKLVNWSEFRTWEILYTIVWAICTIIWCIWFIARLIT